MGWLTQVEITYQWMLITIRFWESGVLKVFGNRIFIHDAKVPSHRSLIIANRKMNLYDGNLSACHLNQARNLASLWMEKVMWHGKLPTWCSVKSTSLRKHSHLKIFDLNLSKPLDLPSSSQEIPGTEEQGKWYLKETVWQIQCGWQSIWKLPWTCQVCHRKKKKPF